MAQIFLIPPLTERIVLIALVLLGVAIAVFMLRHAHRRRRVWPDCIGLSLSDRCALDARFARDGWEGVVAQIIADSCDAVSEFVCDVCLLGIEPEVALRVGADTGAVYVLTTDPGRYGRRSKRWALSARACAEMHAVWECLAHRVSDEQDVRVRFRPALPAISRRARWWLLRERAAARTALESELDAPQTLARFGARLRWSGVAARSGVRRRATLSSALSQAPPVRVPIAQLVPDGSPRLSGRQRADLVRREDA